MRLAIAALFAVAFAIPAAAQERPHAAPAAKKTEGAPVRFVFNPGKKPEKPKVDYRIPGEKLDSGAGNPDVYREWVVKQAAAR